VWWSDFLAVMVPAGIGLRDNNGGPIGLSDGGGNPFLFLVCFSFLVLFVVF
jgi:hypothetical protein